MPPPAMNVMPERRRFSHEPHAEPERHLRHLHPRSTFIIIDTHYSNMKSASNYLIKLIPCKMNSTIIDRTSNEMTENLRTIVKSSTQVETNVMQFFTVNDKTCIDKFYLMGPQIVNEEAAYKLYRVKKVLYDSKGMLYCTTHESMSCYLDPDHMKGSTTWCDWSSRRVRLHILRLPKPVTRSPAAATTWTARATSRTTGRTRDPLRQTTPGMPYPSPLPRVLLYVFLIDKGTKLWTSAEDLRSTFDAHKMKYYNM
jgi:hypothetical protein